MILLWRQGMNRLDPISLTGACLAARGRRGAEELADSVLWGLYTRPGLQGNTIRAKAPAVEACLHSLQVLRRGGEIA